MREEVCQQLHTQRNCGLYIFVMVATQFRRQALLMTQKEKNKKEYQSESSVSLQHSGELLEPLHHISAC